MILIDEEEVLLDFLELVLLLDSLICLLFKSVLDREARVKLPVEPGPRIIWVGLAVFSQSDEAFHAPNLLDDWLYILLFLFTLIVVTAVIGIDREVLRLIRDINLVHENDILLLDDKSRLVSVSEEEHEVRILV